VKGLKKLVMLGAALMGLSVMLGAFGAHALKAVLSAQMLSDWQTGVHYQMIHGLGILIGAVLFDKYAIKAFKQAAWFMAFGILFFSGSLYALALSGVLVLGAITPIGGVLFILGWVYVMIGAAKIKA
jgi:uncharacterized membrane protein YgdD (TMEM256/DUF423 family)